MSSKLIEAGKAFVRILADDKEFSSAMTKARKKMEDFALAGDAISKRMAVVGTATSAAIGYITKAYADAGTQLQNMSAKADMSVEYLSKMGHAVKEVGIEITDFVDANKDLSKNFAEAAAGNQGLVDTFQSIGVSIQSLKGLNAEERFAAIAEALSKVPDHAQRSAVAMKLMGDNGFKMLPMLSGGIAGIEEAMKQAKDAGAEWTTEQAEQAAEMKKNLNAINSAVMGVANSFVAAAAPAIVALTDQIKAASPHIIKFINNNEGMVTAAVAMAGATATAGAGLMGVVKVCATGSAVLGAFGTDFSKLRTGLLAAGKMGGIATVVALVSAAYVAAEGSVRRFNQALEKSVELSEKVEELNKGKNADRLSKIGGVGDPQSRARMLRAEQSRLNKELAGNKAGLKSSEKQQAATRTWQNAGMEVIGVGSADKRAANQQVDSDRAAVRQTEAALAKVNEAIKQADQEMAALGQARLDEMNRLHEEEKKAYEAAAEAERQAAEQAAADLERELGLLAEKVMTPVEKMSREMARYQELFDSGLIDQETFDRANKLAQIDTGTDQIKQAGTQATNAAAVQQGSQEAFSAIVRSMSGGQQADQQIASNTQKMVNELQKLNRAPVQKITIREV